MSRSVPLLVRADEDSDYRLTLRRFAARPYTGRSLMAAPKEPQHQIGLVHLVRAANGVDALKGFLNAYRTTTGSKPYELIFLCKGSGAVEQAKAAGSDLLPKIHVLPDSGFDIGSYVRIARILQHPVLCFVNSWARPRMVGWLDWLVQAAMNPSVGIAGATGSLEGVPPHTRFPNPHVRTNAFAIRRNLFLELSLPEPQTKTDAILLEAGPNSITKQILARRLRAVVVSKGGSAHELTASRGAGVYRSHHQCNLIVSDNVTDLYKRSSRRHRAQMEAAAWGSSEQ